MTAIITASMFVKCNYWHGTTLKWFFTWHLTSVYLLLTSSIKRYWAWSGNQPFTVKYWSRNNCCRESGKPRQKCREAVAPEVIGRRLPRIDRVSWKFRKITCCASCCSSLLAQTGCKESQFYSLPFWQAVASLY